jgi:polysaccharide deacetylase family protein (PEP-CTERM system associated)
MTLEPNIDLSMGSDPASAIAGWHGRPAATAFEGVNAFTIDVEDYFQVAAFFGVINRDDWDGYECRVEANVDRILALLAEVGARGTFFTLGWIAQRYPGVVRAIVGMGHELASHGWDHRHAYRQTRTEFLADVARTKALLEDQGGCEVKGYRAPHLSISRNNLWAMASLAEAGYSYSSSTYPILHDTYGIPEGPRFPFHPLPECTFLEIPVTSVRLFGRNWPCGGGGYFRLLPYEMSARALARVNREGKPCVFYSHPWEVDPGQPRIAAAPLKSRARHYLNLNKTETRLARLLQAFRWGRMDEIFLPPAALAS